MKRIRSINSVFSCGFIAGGGLIEEQDLWIRGKGPGDFRAGVDRHKEDSPPVRGGAYERLLEDFEQIVSR